MNNVYRAVIIAHYSDLPVMTEEEIREDEAIEFDYVDDKTVSSDATITSAPTVEGDCVSDHMYRNPKSVTIPGKFSLYGNKGSNFIEDANRLTAIQKKFEAIQAKAIRCTIVTRKSNNNEDCQFVTRENMYLKSIQWTEKADSVDFTFSFDEVIEVSVDKIKYDENVVDDTLPSLTEPVKTTTPGLLLDFKGLQRLVDKVCLDAGLMKKDFYDALIASSIGIGVASLGALMIVYGVEASSGPVGWVAAGVTTIGVAGFALYKYLEGVVEGAKYRYKQFKYYKDEVKRAEEYKRYTTLRGQIVEQMQKIEQLIDMYEIKTNEEQESIISIDDDYYNFKFTWDNANGWYKLSIQDYTYDEEYFNPSLGCITNLADCKNGNRLFRTKDHGFSVYLMCPALMFAKYSDYEAIRKDLRNYKIVVLKYEPEEFSNIMIEVIRNAILR